VKCGLTHKAELTASAFSDYAAWHCRIDSRSPALPFKSSLERARFLRHLNDNINRLLSTSNAAMKAIIAVPATLALVYRAWSHKSLTPAGIVAAALTAVAHAIHPWNLPFVLLVVFFLAGTRVTKVF
jgi:hypothetical protein